PSQLGGSSGTTKVRVPPLFGLSASADTVAASGSASPAASATTNFKLSFFIVFLPGFRRAPSSEMRTLNADSHKCATPIEPRDLDFRASNPMARLHLSQVWQGLAASFDGQRATRMEHAAGRRIHRARHLTLDSPVLAPFLDRRIGDRHGLEQCPRVRMQRIAVQLITVGELDHLAKVHDRDTMAQVTDNAEIMGNEEVGEVELVAEIFEEIDDLCLDGHVERRDCLVANNKFGPQRERTCNTDALALSTAHFVGVAAGKLFRQAADVQQLMDTPFLRPPVRLDVMHADRFADDLANPHARVERAVRVLEDDLDTPAQTAQRFPVQVAEVETVEQDFALRRAFELQDAAAGRGLAAARLADKAERLAAANIEADAVDGLDLGNRARNKRSLGDWEIFLEAADADEGVALRDSRTGTSNVRCHGICCVMTPPAGSLQAGPSPSMPRDARPPRARERERPLGTAPTRSRSADRRRSRRRVA